jgi:hypothetical protein
MHQSEEGVKMNYFQLGVGFRVLALTILSLALFVPGAGALTLLNQTQWRVEDGGNGHWYAIMTDRMIWGQALVEASTSRVGGYYGYLATITSHAENQFIFTNIVNASIQPNYGDQLWLGGRDIGGGNWQWINGEAMNYTNWAPGEPNNLGSELTMSMWDIDFNQPNQVPGMWNNSLANERDWWSIIEWGDPSTAIQDPYNPNHPQPNPVPPAVPEPLTIFLIGLGLLIIARRIQR